MLTPAQQTALKADMTAKALPGGPFVEWLPGNNFNYIAQWYGQNASPSFTVWKKSINTSDVGRTVNYIAVAAMTTANLDRVNNFYNMNPVVFDPSRDDIRTFWNDTFSGALGGQGQATRDALMALWKRLANNVEKLFATGTASDAVPAQLVYEGTVTEDECRQAYQG